MEFNDTIVLITAVVILVLAIVVYITYYINRDKLTVSNVEDDVILRTGGSAGSAVVNMYETTQPGQGPQLRTPSWDKLWMNNIPSRYENRESLTDNRCSAYGGDNQYLDKYLNVRTPNGGVVYDPMAEVEFSKDAKNAMDVVDEEKNRHIRMYNDCIRRGGTPTTCSVPFSNIVDGMLRSDAWGK